jgi:hypothetical protein
MRKGKAPAETPRGAWGKPDPWQTAVYAFEHDWPGFDTASLTLQECRAIVGTACAAYDLDPPSVVQHQGSAYSYALSNDKTVEGWKISLRRSHKNPAIVLHESAHFIVDRIYGVRGPQQDHGPTWQGVYFWLLARAELAPVEALRASARKHGLRWQERGPDVICK